MVGHSSMLRDVCLSYERLTVSSEYRAGQLHVEYEPSTGTWIVGINRSGRSKWAHGFV